MATDRDKVEVFLFVMAIVVIALLMVVGGGVGYKIAEVHWQREAVKHGAAEYDSQTGAWQWKPATESD